MDRCGCMWIKAKWIVENSCTWMRYWCTVVVEAQVLYEGDDDVGGNEADHMQFA